ncbi:hypothetical protein DCD74_04775 [Lysobacter oculi]|uniref:Uncharacterized protein n=1 Tax=Solilutibacter oculi TaxID=2698682 RepID=A0A344J4Z0_9GAMM|nr:hypothetical protein DCD74_04775 [Lysobacter oculi]
MRQLEHRVFGQPAWLVTVTVLRDTDADDEDVDIDVVLTEIVLGNHPLPQVSDDVQGTGWVQGWMAG